MLGRIHARVRIHRGMMQMARRRPRKSACIKQTQLRTVKTVLRFLEPGRSIQDHAMLMDRAAVLWIGRNIRLALAPLTVRFHVYLVTVARKCLDVGSGDLRVMKMAVV